MADGQRFGAHRDAATSQNGSRNFKTTAIGISTFLNEMLFPKFSENRASLRRYGALSRRDGALSRSRARSA